MQIRELEQWPPSTWATTGTTRLTPDLATAIIKNVRTAEECVFLRFEDGGKIYGTVLVLRDKDLAKRVTFTLEEAIGKTILQAGELILPEMRTLRL